MAPCGRITKFPGMNGETTFEWNIKDLIKKQAGYYESPCFDLTDSSWSLALYPYDNSLGCYGCAVLELNRIDGGEPKTITFTLGIKRTNDKNETVFTQSFCFDSLNSSYRKSFFEKLTFRSRFNSAKNVTMTCCIMKRNPFQETSFVSVATQTKVPKNVIENSEEWSSLVNKGVALLRDHMKDLLIKGNDYDVTICVKSKEFRAHRNILSACSPVFAMMLNHDTKEKNTGTINIEDCDPDSFDEFLLYAYSGKTENLTPDKAVQLYFTADKYDFPVLKRHCVSHLKSSLSTTSICDVILLATKYDEEELLEVATKYCARNMKEILVTDGWQNFLAQNPVAANELYIESIEILLPKK